MGSVRTFFNARAQVRQFFINVEWWWCLRIGDGRNEFFAEAGENGRIVEDVEACDAQRSFCCFDAGADQGGCLVMEAS